MSTSDEIRLEEIDPVTGHVQPDKLSPKVSESPSEGTTVFTTPNAREVRGKLLGTYWAVFIAGLNGTTSSKPQPDVY